MYMYTHMQFVVAIVLYVGSSYIGAARKRCFDVLFGERRTKLSAHLL